MTRIYLDNAATTPVDSRVQEAMAPFWTEKFGNPSSIHMFGQETRVAIEAARSIIAEMLNASPSEIVFTSGGSESDNTALLSAAHTRKERGRHIITSQIEHHAILHTCDWLESLGYRITRLPVSGQGIIDLNDLEKALDEETILISIHHANNEIGTVQPIADIGALARQKGVLFHTDAVQTFGHLPIDVKAMNIDMLSLSAHKLYGPKGVGVLYLRKETPFVPYLHGGAQEEGRRSSTHNVPGIVGLGKAAEIAGQQMDQEHIRIRELRTLLLNSIHEAIDGVHLNGSLEYRLDNNLNLSIEKVEGESLLMNLDIEGIAASSGSACSAGSSEPSHVLRALGLPLELTRGSLRLTLGRFTTRQEIVETVDVLKRVVTQLRSLSPF